VLAGAIVFNVIKEKLCPAAGTPGFGVFWRSCAVHGVAVGTVVET